MDWLFNAAPVLKERAACMALNEGLTHSWNPERRTRYTQKSMAPRPFQLATRLLQCAIRCSLRHVLVRLFTISISL